jgi:hypothetical protein
MYLSLQQCHCELWWDSAFYYGYTMSNIYPKSDSNTISYASAKSRRMLLLSAC